MEARDSRSKIRPLPIDEIDGDALPQHRVDPPRRWLPLAVIAVGAIAFGIVARGLSPTPDPDAGAAATTTTPVMAAEPEPTTTTQPPPPPPEPLGEMLPAASDGLSLVTLGSSGRIATWGLDEIAPEIHANAGRPVAAAYNANGSLVALRTAVRDGTLVIDRPTGGSPIYVQPNIWSAVWHPGDPSLIAWTVAVETAPDEWTSSLRIADVTGYTATGVEPLVDLPMPKGLYSLLAWGDWGFVIRDRADATGPVIRTGPDLLNPVELDGVFFDATADGRLLMARTDDTGYVPYLLEPDGSEVELVGLDIGASNFRITSDGQWVIALTPQADSHTSVLARTVRSRSTRLSSVEGPARFVSFALDDRFVVLQEEGSGDLVFKDWNTGAEFRIPIENGELIAAVYL